MRNLFFVFAALSCSVSFAQMGNITPIPQSLIGYVSEECEDLEIKLGECSDAINGLNMQIQAKNARIWYLMQEYNNLSIYRNSLLRMGQPVPPGVTAIMKVYFDNWIPRLQVDLRDLQFKLKLKTQEWSDLWVQWELAGC